MSRNRWLVLLGPPLVIAVAAAGAALTLRPPARAIAGVPVPPQLIGSCPVGTAFAGVMTGTPSWSQSPLIDAGGTLTGWQLTAGAAPGRVSSLILPPESRVGGPTGGDLVVASDDGRGSRLRLINVEAGCAVDVDAGREVARSAAFDPAGDALLVHRLDRATRRDLGVWRVFLDGRPMVRVLEPLPTDARAAAGIDRVWSTELLIAADGTAIAVRSCDPAHCVVRVLDLPTGAVRTLPAEWDAALDEDVFQPLDPDRDPAAPRRSEVQP